MYSSTLIITTNLKSHTVAPLVSTLLDLFVNIWIHTSALKYYTSSSAHLHCLVIPFTTALEKWIGLLLSVKLLLNGQHFFSLSHTSNNNPLLSLCLNLILRCDNLFMPFDRLPILMNTRSQERINYFGIFEMTVAHVHSIKKKQRRMQLIKEKRKIHLSIQLMTFS